MPSQIECLKENGNWRVYGTTCACSSHQMQVTVEYDQYKDEQGSNAVLELFFETRVGYWEDWKFSFAKYWKRLTAACSILFLGTVEHSEAFIFRGDEHVKELLETIISVRNDMVKDTHQWGLVNLPLIDMNKNLQTIKDYTAVWRQGDPSIRWDNDNYPPDGDPNVEMEEHVCPCKRKSTLTEHEEYCLKNGIDPFLQVK